MGLVSIGIAIAFNQYYGPSLYPGAVIWVSTLLAALGMVTAAATFYFWSTIFPRSGGVYVSLSRATTSWLAFVFSVVETMILLYYGALAASLIVKVGLSSFFATVGSIGGSETLVEWAGSVAEPAGVFWIGTGVLIVAGLLLVTGTRRYFTVQKVLFGASRPRHARRRPGDAVRQHGDFHSNLTHLTGLDYDKVIAGARKEGYGNLLGRPLGKPSSSWSGRCCRCWARSNR